MRAINFRAFLIVSAAVTGAVLCTYLYMCFETAGTVVGAVYLAAVAAVSVVFIVKSVTKQVKLRVGMAFALAFLLAVSAFAFGVSYVNSRSESESLGGERSVVGRVCAVDVRNGKFRVDLEDLEMDGKPADGVLRISVRSSGDRNIAKLVECGDVLSFDAKIKCMRLVENGKVNGSSCRSDIRFTATVSSDAVKIKFGEPTAIEGFLTSLRRHLTQNMGDKYGNIAFSMITGDKHTLDRDISDYFSVAGLAHIMAVSGLHIGFMVVLLNLVLCRIGKKTRFCVIACMLAAYVVIADFSPSVVRAAIMSLVAMFSVFVGGRRDLLSSMLCAYSFILAFAPMYLFETGFTLSFGAIFGIAMFARPIARFLVKHGLHRKASEAVASSAAVEIGVVPSLAYHFGKFQTLALLVNAVLIPYISVVFIAIVVFAAIGAIPGLGAALVVPKYLLMPVDYIAQGIAAVPYSTFDVHTGVAAFLCYPVMFFASGHLMMPKKARLAVAIASVMACAAFLCVAAAPPKSVNYYMPAQSASVRVSQAQSRKVVAAARVVFRL